MTTIVYDHKNKQIACDGRILNDRRICSDKYTKWRESGGVFYFFAGPPSDIDDYLNASKETGYKPNYPIEVSCLMVKNGKVYECGYDDHAGYWELEVCYNAAIGSGGEFALSALEFERSAKEAIEFATKMDSGTGGQITVFDVDKMQFCGGTVQRMEFADE